MNSETPKDAAGPSSHEAGHKPASDKREHPGSLGLEMLEPTPGDGVDHHGHGNESDAANFLMPHERKLPLSEQRQILAMRRRTDDEVDEEEVDVRTGRRYAQWKLHNEQHGKGGSSHGPSDQSERAPTVAELADRLPGSELPLNDPGNPHKPLFDAVLKGVGDLDASKSTLSPAEQVNVAGALTASMLHTPGFQRHDRDPATFSIAMSDSGDRFFAINSPHLDAPGALHTSVVVDQARQQSLDISSAQAALPILPPPAPAVEQPKQQEEIIPPRSIGSLS